MIWDRFKKWSVAALGIGALTMMSAGGMWLAEAANAAEPGEVAVTNAQFNWQINDEAGGGAYYGGCNFLVAGTVPDQGSSKLMTQDLYSATSGNVSIVKPSASGALEPATWQNKCLNTSGKAVSTAVGSTTANQVQLTQGAGTLNTSTQTGSLKWPGSFTVVYYGGLTYWSVRDLTLTINNGKGSLTATAFGFGASMDDPTKWVTLSDQTIDLATFSGAKIAGDSFTIQPDYLGVQVSGDGIDQVRTGDVWGSFPQSFIDFNVLTGQAGYWYSSKGAADPKKPAKPFTVKVLESGPQNVNDMKLQWQLNDLIGAGGTSGSCNFLLAGMLADLGSATAVPKDHYVTDQGNTHVTKPDANGKQQTPTFENKCTNAQGGAVSTTSSSGNQVTIDGGTGAIDTQTNSATLAWDGSFTMVLDGGASTWSVRDLRLQLNNGSGALTATASGFGTVNGAWGALPERQVTLADIAGATVSAQGFSAQPAFAGVEVSGDGITQSRTGSWGAFPQSFVSYSVLAGQGDAWFTSGASNDALKSAKPFSLARPAAETPDPAPGPTTGPTTAPTTGPTTSPTTSPTPVPTTEPTQNVPSDGATFYWGLSKESQGGAFFGGCNFYSAGVAGDTGSSRLWTANDYQATSGNTTIEKVSGSSFTTASWDTKCKDRNGTTVSVTGKGSYTESQVKITNGKVTQRADGGVRVEWDGGFTVVFYGGLTYWSAVNPVLELDASGNGKVTATGTGYGASMTDSTKWEKLPDRTITLADLHGVNVRSLADTGGFTITPDYLGVAYTGQGSSQGVPDSGESTATGQAPRTADNEAYWGSFPSSFVDFQSETGQFSYWFTSGGQRDMYKPALPLTVSFGSNFTPGVGNYDGTGAPSINNSKNNSGTVGNTNSNTNGTQTKPNSTAPQQGAGAGQGIQDDGQSFNMQAPATEYVAADAPIELTPQMIFSGGAGIAALAGVNLGVGFLVRRRLGLDPTGFQ